MTTSDFATLKAEIVALATALYGTTSLTPSSAFDIVSYTTLTSTAANEKQNKDESLNVALIAYTGPASTPFTAWEMLSYVEDQASVVAGASRILEDLRRAVGGVVVMVRKGRMIETGDWTVRHKRVVSGDGDEEGWGGKGYDKKGAGWTLGGK